MTADPRPDVLMPVEARVDPAAAAQTDPSVAPPQPDPETAPSAGLSAGAAQATAAVTPEATSSARPLAPVEVAQPNSERRSGWLLTLTALVALAAVISSALMWQKISTIQEQLARQSADASAVAVEARTLAREAEVMARDAAARISLTESRVNEVALQRRQLEDLMQSLSRSRDENLVVDIDSAIRLSQQQAQLAGSVEPLLAALRSAEARVSRAAQPRLSGLQRALARDIERVRSAAVADTPSLLARIDDLARQVDELPLVNSPRPAVTRPAVQADSSLLLDWQRALLVLWDEVRALLRVSTISQPDGVLLSPEQSFFVRENIKLKLLNARLGVLSRQPESVRVDLSAAALALSRYFDGSSRRTQTAAQLLGQLQQQSRNLELPRVDDSLTALATAAAGR